MKAIRMGYYFGGARKEQGHEIWCNLTGGANAIGFSLLTMGRMTLRSSKHYILSQSNERGNHLILPPNANLEKDEWAQLIPFLASSPDSLGFYYVLSELENRIPRTNEELFGMVGANMKAIDRQMDLQMFARRYMVKLHSLGYTEFNTETQLISILEEGRKFLEELKEFENQILMEEIVLDANKEEGFRKETEGFTWFSKETL